MRFLSAGLLADTCRVLNPRTSVVYQRGAPGDLEMFVTIPVPRIIEADALQTTAENEGLRIAFANRCSTREGGAAFDQARLIDRLTGQEALPPPRVVLSMLNDRFDAELLAAWRAAVDAESASRTPLAVVQVAQGHENIDKHAAASLGIAVTNTPGTTDIATSRQAAVLLLTAWDRMEDVPEAHQMSDGELALVNLVRRMHRVEDGERLVRSLAWDGFRFDGTMGQRLRPDEQLVIAADELTQDAAEHMAELATRAFGVRTEVSELRDPEPLGRADHIASLTVSCYRAVQALEDLAWSRSSARHYDASEGLPGGADRGRPRGMSARRKRIGLVGLGTIGAGFADIMEALGAEAFFYIRREYSCGEKDVKKRREIAPRTEVRDLDELLALRELDALSIHAAAPDRAEQALHRGRIEELERVQNDRPFVVGNTARGSWLPDEAFFAEVLGRQKMWGAALDVFVNEHHPDRAQKVCPGLWQNPRLALAPHWGTQDPVSRRMMWTRAFEFNALRFVRGERPADLLNEPGITWKDDPVGRPSA